MGIILSRFRKKKSTLEVLEGLESAIKSIEQYRQSTEQQHRKILGHLMLYSAGLYVLAAFLFYFCLFPATRYEQILYLMPLLIMPILFVFVRRLVTWYYRRKLSRNETKLRDMRQQKKELLEEVMDKETYKVARQILEKFAPDQLKKPPISVSPRAAGVDSAVVPKPGLPPGTPLGPLVPVGSELRRRPIGNVNTLGSPPGRGMPMGPTPPGRVPMPVAMSPGAVPRESPPSGGGEVKLEAGAAPAGGGGGGDGADSAEDAGERPAPAPLPRPVLPRDRSVMDRLVEYLVGDGPSNRYALICRQCASHNGMALREEFDYLTFRCCYCFHVNPARKQRPQAPRLEASPASHPSTSTSEAESPATSSSDEEEEEVEEEQAATKAEASGKEETAEGMQQQQWTQRAPVSSQDKAKRDKRESPAPGAGGAPVPGNPFDSSSEEDNTPPPPPPPLPHTTQAASEVETAAPIPETTPQ